MLDRDTNTKNLHFFPPKNSEEKNQDQKALTLFRLAQCYDKGIDVEKDQKEAVRLYRLARDQGLADAQFALGQHYRRGHGVTKNHKEAVRLYHLYVTTEQVPINLYYYTHALYYLATYYMNGHDGVEKNVKKAAFFYHLGAILGDDEAQYQLGLCYENGIGINKDINEARRYYTLADKKNSCSETQESLRRVGLKP